MGKARVLVVDDVTANIEILREVLSPKYSVSFALNGFDAIELASSQPQPDLILLDIMMPGIDGYKVCKILKGKEDVQRIPIIFVTSMAEAQSEEKGFRLGAVDYITKPFNPAVVLARVRTHIALYNQTRLLQDLVRERTEELEKAKVDAEKANKAKSNFLANITHELRTPLNGILGMTQILMDSGPSAEQKEFLQYAHTASIRLLDMVNDLLSISRAEAGKIDITPSDFNVRESLEGVLSHYEKRAAEKGLDFSFFINEDLPEILIADITKIRQVMINLLNNAIQFTHKGSISLSVSSINDKSDEVNLYFSVADTGDGIPEKEQENVFEPFTIGENYMTKKYGGAGLGLAISKRLVDHMHGNIWLDSSSSDGTSFSFYVPCKK